MSVAKSSESSDSQLIVSETEIESDCDNEDESKKSGGTEGGSNSEAVKILKKKKRSPVWDFFVAVDLTTAKCNVCKTIVQRKSGNTSAMARHLNKHPVEAKKFQMKQATLSISIRDEKETTIEKAFAGQRPLELNSAKSKNITTAIAQMMARDLQPYSIVEDVGFRNLMKVAEPRYIVPSRTTFSRSEIPKMYRVVRLRVLDTIQSDFSKGVRSIALTTDGWTSRGVESYMTLTIHYTTADFEHRFFLLNMRYFPESHTANNLHRFIEESLIEWKLDCENRPIFVATDNAPNIVRAVSLNDKWERIPCFAHTLQLAIKDGVKQTTDFAETRKRCRSIVGFFARSSTAHAKLDDMQTSLNPGSTPLKLIQDVDTRWNSEYDMFHRLLQVRTALGAVLSLPKMPNNLSNTEWNIIQMYADVLGPFKDATVVMSAEKHPTLSSYIPIIRGLIHATQDFIKENSEEKRNSLGKHLLSSMEERFNEVCEKKSLLLAMMVDPRYKNRLLTTEEKIKIEEMLIKKVIELQEVNSDLNATDASAIIRESTRDEPPSKLFKYLATIEIGEEINDSNTPLLEVKRYLSDKVSPSTTNARSWWKINCQQYPGISKVAAIYLSVPATQVSSEQTFSTAGNIVTPTRARLITEHVEELCFLHYNL